MPTELIFSYIKSDIKPGYIQEECPRIACIKCTFVSFFRDRLCHCDNCKEATSSATFGPEHRTRQLGSVRPIVCPGCVHEIRVPPYVEKLDFTETMAVANMLRDELLKIEKMPDGCAREQAVFDFFSYLQGEREQIFVDQQDGYRQDLIDKICSFSHTNPAFVRTNLEFFESCLRSYRAVPLE